MDQYEEWCQERGASHAHCPVECDHPQPLMYEGKLVCGRCLLTAGIVNEMIPCTPEVCE